MALMTTIRQATREDVPAIVDLLADDPLGKTRENPGDPAYLTAFDDLTADPHQILIVADADGEVVGTLQLIFIAGLSRRGATRAQVEAVRVKSNQRGAGLGAELIRWAIDAAKERDCALIQLTSDATRIDAHRFYERLGFAKTHVGMKLPLQPTTQSPSTQSPSTQSPAT